MSLSTLRASALIFAGLMTANAIDETYVNAKWTIALDESVESSSYLFSGVVSYEGKPLCDDHMNDAAATALCRHFQLGNYGEFEGYVDVGTDDFGADDLQCPDDAAGLHDCTFNTETENCYSHEGVRIMCSMFTLQKPPVMWELYEHNIPKNIGIVYYNFMPVCDDYVNENAAIALCKTMNLGSYGELIEEQDVQTDEFSLDNLDCPEGAESIRDCTFLHQSDEDCSSHEGLGLICSDGFRLHGPGSSREGFVLFKGQAVCEVGDMTPLAANLLCQNMGKGTTGAWETRDIVETVYWDQRGFGADNPSCQRGEQALHECNWLELENLPCDSNQALYLTCSFDGWTMEAASFEFEHGEDREHSGFVHYEGKPLCDDFMSAREASMLCYQMHYGAYQDIGMGPFHTAAENGYYGVYETRDVGTDDFGADNLFCPFRDEDLHMTSINDCEWDTTENCVSGEGVWLECHRGWLLEKPVWGNLEEHAGGFLTFDRKSVCITGFTQASADAMCHMWYGPFSTGVFQQKARTTTVIWGEPPTVSLICPDGAFTAEQCVIEHTDDCEFTQAVYLECQFE